MHAKIRKTDAMAVAGAVVEILAGHVDSIPGAGPLDEAEAEILRLVEPLRKALDAYGARVKAAAVLKSERLPASDGTVRRCAALYGGFRDAGNGPGEAWDRAAAEMRKRIGQAADAGGEEGGRRHGHP